MISLADASIHGRLATPITRHDRVRRNIHRGAFYGRNLSGFTALNLRGGADENESKPQLDEKPRDGVAAAPADKVASTDAETKRWFHKTKSEAPAETSREPNENYVEFTMNSNGQTTNIEVQAPSIQNELNKTLTNLNELQNKIKEQEHPNLVTANGVANGGASAGHMSAKFPISREELPHFSCMSVLMFLFIYVFTTGEYHQVDQKQTSS